MKRNLSIEDCQTTKMFRFAFGKLGGLFEFQAAFFAVEPKQP